MLHMQMSHLSGLVGLTRLALNVHPEVLQLDTDISALTAMTGMQDMHLCVQTSASLEVGEGPIQGAVTGALPSLCNAWPSLRSLSLPCNTISADGMAALGKLSGLRTLDVHTFETKPCSAPGAFPQLKSLTVDCVNSKNLLPFKSCPPNGFEFDGEIVVGARLAFACKERDARK